MRARAIRGVCLAAVAILGACAVPRGPIQTPMPSLALGTPPGPCRRAVIFLPGRRDRAADFSRHAFAETAREAGWDADFLAADATMAYYREGLVTRRLREDVVLPARARGRDEIWLAGISLGGLGALAYAREYPSDLAGIILLSPYLGPEALIGEIRAAGSLASWDPGPVPPGKDLFRDIWAWAKVSAPFRPPAPAVYLGYGSGDRYAPGQALLAAALPPERVLLVPGGHDWPTWGRLWREFVPKIAGAPTGPTR